MQVNEVALKPGQKKALKLDITSKTKNIEDLTIKVDDYERQLFNLTVRYSQALLNDPEMASHIKALESRAKVMAADLKKQIAVIKKQIAKEKELLKTEPSSGFKKLEQECSQYIAAFKKTKRVLFRGTSGDDMFVGLPDKNRQTRDSSPAMQIAYDLMLKKNGIKALRSNSIFTTSDLNQAEEYGKLFIIIPKNTAVYSWAQSGEGKDIELYPDVSFLNKSLAKQIAIEFRKLRYDGNTVDIDYTYYTNFWDYVYEIQKISKKFLRRSKERLPKSAIKWLEKLSSMPVASFFSLDALAKWYKPTDKKFEVALSSQHEVLIHGQYYAFDCDKYNQAISHWLGFEVY